MHGLTVVRTTGLVAFWQVVGGRLVYWLPVIKEEYTDAQVPQHPCLALIANGEQLLSETPRAQVAGRASGCLASSWCTPLTAGLARFITDCAVTVL